MILVSCLLCLASANSQELVDVEPGLADVFPNYPNVILVDNYEPSQGPKVELPMSFGSPMITGEWNNTKIDKRPMSVNIIMTLYPSNLDTFQIQYKQLITDRIANIVAMDPFLLYDTALVWNLYIQTGRDHNGARSQFHGAHINYAPFLSSTDREEYKDRLYAAVPDTAQNEYSRQLHNVLTRNCDNWNNTLVITDCTGSMLKYRAGVVLWHVLHQDTMTFKRFAFFNDGDNMPDHLKQIGKAGGVYFSGKPDPYKVQAMMNYVLDSGSGGSDIRENDLEAIVKGIDIFPDVDEIVLICDNNAPPRDISLLGMVDKPVRVIVCGGDEKIQEEYIRLARQTGGSVHTMEQDLEELSELAEL